MTRVDIGPSVDYSMKLKKAFGILDFKDLGRHSQIYCSGPLLESVQNAHLFPDSKHFVDMALKRDPVTVLRNFHELNSITDLSKDIPLLKRFVAEHFNPPGTELVPCSPEDYDPNPYTFKNIKDYRYRRWALALNRLWKVLCRQVSDEVRDHPELYSILYVPNPFVIPGGRFREFYYWDSFWIVKGLLFSEMYTTAKGVIRNLAYMVDNYGFVPNGGRVYYMMRSQPPLLITMVYDFYVATGDIELVEELLPTLEKEYNFWLQNRGTTWKTSSRVVAKSANPLKLQFFQYKATIKMPRPESYREDLELVYNVSSNELRESIWSNIASAAETGWDFSTRWFAKRGPQAFHMQSIRTWSIIPVDLNAFMCMNTRILSSLFEITGNISKVLSYQVLYEQAKAAMHKIHWNEEDGIWYDYDLDTQEHVKEYYVSNALPLFAKCYDQEDIPRRIYQYLQGVGAFDFAKGIPTSRIDSGQQWDSSNAWPPMVHMLIDGFRNSGDPLLIDRAQEIALKWLKVNYKAYISTHAMYEKYNVSGEPEAFAGSGGEYEVQVGFGWTNGVILDLLSKYGDVATVSLGVNDSPSVLFVMLICLVLFLLQNKSHW